MDSQVSSYIRFIWYLEVNVTIAASRNRQIDEGI